MSYTKKQKQYIIEANHRWNIKSGAVRSGKSYVDVTAIIPIRIRERAGKDGLNVIIGVSKETIERNVLQPMRERYTSELVGTINNRNIAMICGEPVYCLGAEKTSQVAKIQGSSIKYAYGDEVAKWSEEVFIMLKSRLDKPYSCFDGALNPEHPTHWFRKFLDSDADIYLQEYTIFDNEFLPKPFVDNLCKEYEGTIYYDRLIIGKWKRAEGAIYRRFADNPDRFLCEVVPKGNADNTAEIKQFAANQLGTISIGVDYGGSKSGHAFVATALTPGYSDLIALASERHFEEVDPAELDAMVLLFAKKVIDKYGYLDYVFYDNAETVLGRGLKKAFANRYPDVIVKGAKKKRILDRIRCLLRLMGSMRFWITSDCETVKTALSEAVWNKDKFEDERLDDGSTDIDTLDSLEYTYERKLKQLIKEVR
jgi:PBSX family phage terminase large subunit